MAYTPAAGARLQAKFEGKVYDERTGKIDGADPLDPDDAKNSVRLKELTDLFIQDYFFRMAREGYYTPVPDDVLVVPDGADSRHIPALFFKQAAEKEAERPAGGPLTLPEAP